jgi:hypothetical protein
MTPIAALVPLSASVTAMSGLVFSQSITETGSGSTETLFTG